MPLHRRRFVNLTATSATASVVTAARIGATKAAPRVKAVAFDGLVVFDLHPVVALTEELFPGRELRSRPPGARGSLNILGYER